MGKMVNDNFVEVMKGYVDVSKTFVQLACAGLVVPVALHGYGVIQLFEHPHKLHSSLGLIFVCFTWLFFLLAIGSGALYQYAAWKLVEKTSSPYDVYVPPILNNFVNGNGPGQAFGAMVIFFYLGAICLCIFFGSVVFG